MYPQPDLTVDLLTYGMQQQQYYGGVYPTLETGMPNCMCDCRTAFVDPTQQQALFYPPN